MLSAAYRLWAKIRLQDVKPWIAGWDLPEIFAGVPGKGAEQAWYKTALEGEYAEMYARTTAYAVIDLSKAFDHIPRVLLYKVLERGGFPSHILTA